MANLALFDLDMTLINVDSDHSWGQYIVQAGLIDKAVYEKANDQFYQDYIAGTLDAVEYNEFVASFLASKSFDELAAYRENYLNTWIKPAMRPKAIEAITRHRAAGDTVVVISATNDFVVVPIAALFGVDSAHTLATRLEFVDNRYTGKVAGRPNFKDGKLYHLQKFMDEARQKGAEFERLIAYSDSKNDLPLLGFADEAVCVTPDDVLRAHAAEQGWRIEDWAM
ncbi:hydrolase [Moraxella caviae]|uniref:ACT domain-containing protein n=1 Tax=Moraxella caviae TaxID=34060 RepID=A0A1S9ZW30_9GAMM|nr:HAD family hydrolase [Moraxella caviae]OOR87732.1 hydrolase [Moraxella caviae]STZ10145.1 ACT domain-containing protein [Moraxella caviae]